MKCTLHRCQLVLGKSFQIATTSQARAYGTTNPGYKVLAPAILRKVENTLLPAPSTWLYRHNVSSAVFVHTADHKYCHAYNSVVHKGFFVQGIRLQNGMTALGKRAAEESICLFI